MCLINDTESVRNAELDDEDIMAPHLCVFPGRQTFEVPVPDPCYHIRSANVEAGLPQDAFLEETYSSADLGYSQDAVKLVLPHVEQLFNECDDAGVVVSLGVSLLPVLILSHSEPSQTCRDFVSVAKA